MRKSRFLISLIAATAIGLSGVGCESSDSGAIQDTSDISNPGGNVNPDESRNLREYLLVAQRGLEVPAASFAAGQSLPTVAGRGTGVTPKDQAAIDAGLMFELTGVTNVPVPNLSFTAPGQPEARDPVTTAEPQDGNFAGFHQIYGSPSGRYVVGMSRAKDNLAVDGPSLAGLQIFQIDTPSVEVTFPPQPGFGVTPERTSIFNFSSGQGEFVSGTWSRDSRFFYAAIQGFVFTVPFTESNGRLDFDAATAVAFPTGTASENNAVQLAASFDGNFVFALDNANGNIITYARDLSDGSLTVASTLATVSDPRGFALDRSGTYLYVVGRQSQQLAGYRVGTDGSLTAIDLFPSSGLGAVPTTFPNTPLGDVATNPRQDELYLGAYSGVISGYTIDPATGALTAGATAARPFGVARNLANLEVEPTGRFVIGAYEHDFDTFQSFVTPANSFPIDESNVFANTDSGTNGAFPISATPSLDQNGRVAYVFPTTEANAFTGGIQAFRILDAAGNVRAEDSVDVSNPYGLGFFQLVIAAPVGTDTPVP